MSIFNLRPISSRYETIKVRISSWEIPKGKNHIIFSYHSFDQVVQHHVKSSGMTNKIDSTFCALSGLVKLHQTMMFRSLHHFREEHAQLLHEMTVYADNLDIRNIYCNDTFSILLRPTEYFPSNCNKSENQPEDNWN